MRSMIPERAIAAATMISSVLLAMPADARPYSEECFDGDNEKGKTKNGKTINGLECQVDWTDRYRDSWGYSDFGQLCNWDDNEELFVHCPLLRTQLDSTEGLNCASATLIHQNGTQPAGVPCSWIAGTQTAGNERFECVLRSAEEHGWFGWWYGWGFNGQPNVKLTEAGGPGKVWQTEWTAHIHKSAIANDEYFYGGTYMISCMLPELNHCGGEVCLSSLKWFEK